MGRNLPLTTRRRSASGLSLRLQRAWARRAFLSLGDGRRASVITTNTGTANKLQIFSVAPGTGGNSITFAIVLGGTAPVVTYAGNAVTLTAPATTTLYQACDAINRSTTTDVAGRLTKLVFAQTAPQSDPANQISGAFGATALSGGSAPG